MKVNAFLIIITVLIVSCSQAPKRKALDSLSEALRPSTALTTEQIVDDFNYDGLAEALKANIQHLKTKPNHNLQFADEIISSQRYLESLEELSEILINSPEQFRDYLMQNFVVYEVYGSNDWGEAFMTAYYAPEIKGSLNKSKVYSQALYTVPDDMVVVRLNEYGKLYGDSLAQRICNKGDQCEINKSNLGILRGRLQQRKGSLSEIVPYYSRAEIDSENKKLPAKVLVYVDPIEAFFLQIQGSGTVVLKNGKKIRVGYAGQNGHGYQAIGKYLFDVIPKEKMSLQTIEAHLRSLPPEEMQQLLNKNPSYVFFQKNKDKPYTYFGIETIDGRTIATDKRYFPKGALGFLMFKKPIFNTETDTEPSSWQEASRFVFDHDTGGAIKGGGRLDLFWGAGALAKQSAGVIKQTGRLYYFKPKNKVLGNMQP